MENQEQRVKVKLSKMSKGYQWEVSINGDDPDKCAEEAHQTDLKLQGMYPD